MPGREGRHPGPWVGDGEPPKCPKQGHNRTRCSFGKVKATASTGVGVRVGGVITDEQSVGFKVVLGANTLTGGLKAKRTNSAMATERGLLSQGPSQRAGWHLSLSITFAFFLTS